MDRNKEALKKAQLKKMGNDMMETQAEEISRAKQKVEEGKAGFYTEELKDGRPVLTEEDKVELEKEKSDDAYVKEIMKVEEKLSKEFYGDNPDKTKMIRKFIVALGTYEERKLELKDIETTIELMQSHQDDNAVPCIKPLMRINGKVYWIDHDCLVSLDRMKERLSTAYKDFRVKQQEVAKMRRMLIEGYKATEEEIEEAYNLICFGESKGVAENDKA